MTLFEMSHVDMTHSLHLTSAESHWIFLLNPLHSAVAGDFPPPWKATPCLASLTIPTLPVGGRPPWSFALSFHPWKTATPPRMLPGSAMVHPVVSSSPCIPAGRVGAQEFSTS
jgi:hypothetical protein